MKRSLLSLVVVLACVAAVLAAPVPTVRKLHVTLQSRARTAVCKIEYPQIHGSAVDASVNRQLAALFIPTAKAVEALGADGLKGQVYSSDVRCEVTLVTPLLLSVKYEGLGMPTENGHIAAAHPTKDNHCYTFDLRTGKLIPLASLFKKGSAWKPALATAVKAHNSPVPPLENGQYGYYLTGHKLVLTNLSDIFAAASVEVPIPFTELKDVLDPNGPLASLLK